jgi:hypothetical protein
MQATKIGGFAGMKKLILALALTGALAAATAATAAAPTVTLSQDHSTIFFGGTIGLTGQITPAATDQKVTITQFPMNRAPISVTVTTNSDGTFSDDISPRFNGRVVAKYTSGSQTANSDELNFYVRPRVSLSKFARNRYAARVVASRPFVGRYVWIQRWNARAHAWRNVFRVQLKHYVRTSGASTTAFRVHFGRRVKLRAFLNDASARPDYVRSWSNFVVSR